MKNVVCGLRMADPGRPHSPFREALEKVSDRLRKVGRYVEFKDDPSEDCDFLVLEVPRPRMTPGHEICKAGLTLGQFLAGRKDIILVGEPYPGLPKRSASRVRIVSTRGVSIGKLADRLTKELKPTVENAIRRVSSDLRFEFCPDRDSAHLDEAFASAREHIHILATNLKWFMEPGLIAALVKAMKKQGISVKILTLDPQSVFVAYRATQLGLQTKSFREEMESSLLDMRNALVKSGCKRYEIRAYDDFPTQVTIAVDRDIYVCTVARASRSRAVCVFKVKLDDPSVERSFVFHYDTLWTIARPLPAAG